jgi:hypothetical protein
MSSRDLQFTEVKENQESANEGGDFRNYGENAFFFSFIGDPPLSAHDWEDARNLITIEPGNLMIGPVRAKEILLRSIIKGCQ